jgi:hypothetical protein
MIADFGLTAITDLANPAATTTVNKAGAIRWLAPEVHVLSFSPIQALLTLSSKLVHQDDGPPPLKTSQGDIFAFGRLCLCVSTRA